MTSTRVFYQAGSAVALTLGMLAGCNSIVGLDKIEVVDAPTETAGAGSTGGRMNTSGGAAGDSSGGGTSGGDANGGTGDVVEAQGGEGGAPDLDECKTNQQCTDQLSKGVVGEGGTGPTIVAGACIKKPHGHCVQLLSEDCDTITGDYTDDNAIFIGSLFSTKGPTAATNLPRQQSAALGVEEINSKGGVPGGETSADGRPLVMISCDESTNLVRAATHLVSDLQVPAIVGPNTSQDTLDVSTKVTVKGGTVVMSPTGVASSIADLSDNDLTWLMVPSDVQRAPLMIDQINTLEAEIKAADTTKTTVKLGVIYRDDALGQGTRAALSSLMINGQPLSGTANQKAVQIDPYNGADANQNAIVTKYTTTFLPDIIVLAGTAEAITKVMQPIEAAWLGPTPPASPPPQYILIDSTKVPELITAVTGNDSLRTRVRGTGITPGPSGPNTPAETFTQFQQNYAGRYPNSSTTISGMGPAHDAAFAIGLALGATRTQEVSGASVAQGLRKLAGGATMVETTPENVLRAMQKLGAGEKVSAIGTFGMLDWDDNGAVQGGTLEIWCIGSSGGKPTYNSSGLTFDIMTQKKSGTYMACPVTQ
jgi:ABC-type branched-subunit amino acid transport system substrate-binding protein